MSYLIRTRIGQAAVFGIVGVVGYLNVSVLWADEFFKEGTPQINAEVSTGGELPEFRALAKELSVTVVNISVDSDEEEEAPEQPVPGLPFFKKEQEMPSHSLGSGFVVNPEGFIVTNNHVLGKGDKITVRLLDDKTEYPAKVIGRDTKTDLALLKIEPKRPLKEVFIGDSDQVEVGEWVLAIGHQFQLGQSVTAGIISATSRKVPGRLAGPYDSYIQTDASINPGSSGGPLVNTKGQVIAVNSAIFSPGRTQFGGTGFNIGIGFAIPINTVKRIILQLKEHGSVIRGLLGVIIQKVDTDVAEALGLGSPDGALVADVVPDTPAGKAGFKRRDVILKYDGHAVKDHDDLPAMVANSPIGSEVSIEIIRDGKPQILKAIIQELKETPAPQERERPKPNDIGIIAESISEEIARTFDLKSKTGVLVTSVEAGSIAEKAGFERGDVVLEIDGKVISNVALLEASIKELKEKKGKPALVLVQKRDGTRFLTLKVK